VASGPPETPPSFELPFMVQGPWDDPIMLPDTQALLSRSPAAAPLLRERANRDTVQRAIERLTRTGSASAPPPPEAPAPASASSTPVTGPVGAAAAPPPAAAAAEAQPAR
jgi:AsmA protein